MTASTQANPSLGSFTAGYDPVAHTTGVALRVANIQTDTSVTPNVTYGDLGVDVTVSISPTANQRVNAQSGDFVAGSVVDLATLLTLSGTPTDANTVNSLMGRLTKIRDLLSATLTVQGTITEANSAAILTQVTNHAVSQGAGGAMGTSWRVAGDYAEQASLSAGALNADLVPATDVSAYKWFSLQVAGTYSGTLAIQVSNDGINFSPSFAYNLSSTSSTAILSSIFSADGIFAGPVVFRYLRVRMTSYTSGTATGTLELYTQPAAVTPEVALGTGSQTIGNVGLIPQTSGGTSTYHAVAAASNNAANVKNSAGQVYGWDISNPSASWRYVKLFNKSTTPVPGTDTPVRTIGIPPGGKAFNQIENGMSFSAGIGIAIVGGIADSDNTSISANDVVVDLDYK